MAQSKHITDMTEGSTLRHFFLFAIPLLAGNLFQQFYNLVDSIVVGNYVGANALASVGTCGSLNFLFFSLSSGLGMIYMPRGIMNGCGDTRFSLINGIAEVCCRVLFAAILTRIAVIGYWGVWLTQGLTWSVTALVRIARYKQGKWQRLTLVQG